MEIETEIEKIKEDILQLRMKRIDLLRRYISDNGLKDILKNIRNCGIKCKVKSFYFDNEDYMYVINLDIPDKDFKSRLKKKHEIMSKAYDGIEEFIIRNVRITGAI